MLNLDKIRQAFDQENLGDDDVLQATRQLRVAILQKQTEHGIPTDADEFEMMHKNIVELDKQAQTNKRLKQDSEQQMVSVAVMNHLMSVMSENLGKRNIFEHEPVGNIPNPIAEISGAASIIDGELEVGVKDQNYDDFMRTKGQEIDAAKRAAAEAMFQDVS